MIETLVEEPKTPDPDTYSEVSPDGLAQSFFPGIQPAEKATVDNETKYINEIDQPIITADELIQNNNSILNNPTDFTNKQIYIQVTQTNSFFVTKQTSGEIINEPRLAESTETTQQLLELYNKRLDEQKKLLADTKDIMAITDEDIANLTSADISVVTDVQNDGDVLTANYIDSNGEQKTMQFDKALSIIGLLLLDVLFNDARGISGEMEKLANHFFVKPLYEKIGLDPEQLINEHGAWREALKNRDSKSVNDFLRERTAKEIYNILTQFNKEEQKQLLSGRSFQLGGLSSERIYLNNDVLDIIKTKSKELSGWQQKELLNSVPSFFNTST